ncbi:MAG TPA: HU family DNA-binding protein [bacterium]|nr:HU family DNA-binding protein [bacterium]
MTRKDLVKSLLKIGLTKRQSQLAVDSFFGSISGALRAGKKVSIVGLGSWEWRKRRARIARNPKSGKRIALASREIVFFKPAPLLRQKIKGKKAN